MRKILFCILMGILLASTLSSQVFAQFDELQIYMPDEPLPYDSTPLTQKLGGIKGKVISLGKKPLSNASIILSNGITATTDSNGDFEINNIEAGVYGIDIFKEGYKHAHSNILVNENEQRTVLVDISPLNYSNPQASKKRENRVAQRPQYTTMNIKAYPTKDLTGGFHNYGKHWWVYSIKVEDKDGNGKWSEIYRRPHHDDGFSSAIKELYCKDVIKGHEYRIEIEWRTFMGGDSKIRYWDEVIDKDDKNFIFDNPLGY